MYTSSLEDLQQYIYNKLEIDHKNGNLVDAGEFEQPFENMVGINAIVTYNGINYGLYCYGILTTPGRAIVTIIGTRDEAIVSHYHNIVQSISFAQPSLKYNSGDPLAQKLTNRKLLYLTSSTGTTGRTTFKLFDDGTFSYNSASAVVAYADGVTGNSLGKEADFGEWGTYTVNGVDMIFFKWNKGNFDARTISFTKSNELLLNNYRYFIVDLDY